MAAYKQTEAYKQFNEHKQRKKMKMTNATDDVCTNSLIILYLK